MNSIQISLNNEFFRLTQEVSDNVKCGSEAWDVINKLEYLPETVKMTVKDKLGLPGIKKEC